MKFFYKKHFSPKSISAKYFSQIVLAVLLSLTVLINVSCASETASFSSGSFNVPADFTGLVHAGGTKTNKEFSYLEYMGVNWVLQTFYWSSIEPEQGEWFFHDYDLLVDKAVAAGVKVIGVLAYDNWWIHDDKDTHRYIPPEKLPDYLEYVRKTAEHFQGRIGAWCIWNEPNFHFWNGTNEEFFELMRQAADVVKETDSEAILLGGAFNRGILGLPEKFIRGLFESGAMDKADAVAFHPYELNPARTLSLYNQFKSITDDYGFADKIWITEVGYPTGGWYPTKVREKNLPEYFIKTWVLLAAAGSNKMFWYQLFDPNTRSGKDSEDYFGLVRSRRDYTSKGAEAFRLCAKYLSGSVCYAQIHEQTLSINDAPVIAPAGTSASAHASTSASVPKSIRSFWFKGTGGGALVIWNEGSGSKEISLQLPGASHMQHDVVSGSASPIPANVSLKAGSVPVFVTWQDAEF